MSRCICALRVAARVLRCQLSGRWRDGGHDRLCTVSPFPTNNPRNPEGRDKGLGVEGVKLLDPLLELIELVRGQQWQQGGGGQERSPCQPHAAGTRLQSGEHVSAARLLLFTVQGADRSAAGHRTPARQSEAAEGGEEDGAAAPEVAVDNGDSALLLMRALAAQDEAVNTQLKGEGGLIATRSCTIM